MTDPTLQESFLQGGRFPAPRPMVAGRGEEFTAAPSRVIARGADGTEREITRVPLRETFEVFPPDPGGVTQHLMKQYGLDTFQRRYCVDPDSKVEAIDKLNEIAQWVADGDDRLFTNGTGTSLRVIAKLCAVVAPPAAANLDKIADRVDRGRGFNDLGGADFLRLCASRLTDVQSPWSGGIDTDTIELVEWPDAVGRVSVGDRQVIDLALPHTYSASWRYGHLHVQIANEHGKIAVMKETDQ